MDQLKIEYKDIDSLIPFSNNARTHSDDQVAQIAASIKQYGFRNPILIDENNGVLAGHGRLLASRKLGLKKVPCVVSEGMSEAQKRAYILADNKIAANSGWDIQMLQGELEFLKETDSNFDFDSIGFNDKELEEITMGGMIEDGDSDDFESVEESELKHKCPRCGFEFDD